MPVALGGLKVSEPLELELWRLVGGHGGAGNRSWVLCESNLFSLALSHLSCPSTLIYATPW